MVIMKKIFLFVLTSIIILSCSKDEEIIFDADPSEVKITFEPANGQTVLHYELPAKSDIFGIQVKYTASRGKEMTKKGSYMSNTIVLDGFIESEDNVDVEISLYDKFDNLSKSISKNFSVLASSNLLVFDNLKVEPYWSGFKVSYTGADDARGFMHIGFEGINPKTKEFDTLLVNTLPVKGEHTYYYNSLTDPNMEDVNVVVWSQNFQNEQIKLQSFNDVEIYKTRLIGSTEVDFAGSSIENELFGYRFLFDGDKVGYKAFMVGERTNRFCFISEKNVIDDNNKNVWTFDLKEPQQIAIVKLYSFLNTFRDYQGYNKDKTPPYRADLEYCLPAHFEIYGTNDPNSTMGQWNKLGEYEESQYLDIWDRWTWRGIDPDDRYTLESLDKFKEDLGNFVSVNCETDCEKYRYIKLRVPKTHHRFKYGVKELQPNTGELYMEEFEIYVKK